MAFALNGTTGLPAGSVDQADLAAGVAGNGPAFSAYTSVAQALTSGVVAKATLAGEEYDTAGAFDSVTNFRFQPTVAGYYMLSGGFEIATTVTSLEAYLYKNGARVKNLGRVYSSVMASVYGTAMIFMNGSTDYVEMWIQAGASQNTVAGVQATYFQGHLVRSA